MSIASFLAVPSGSVGSPKTTSLIVLITAFPPVIWSAISGDMTVLVLESTGAIVLATITTGAAAPAGGPAPSVAGPPAGGVGQLVDACCAVSCAAARSTGPDDTASSTLKQSGGIFSRWFIFAFSLQYQVVSWRRN